MRGSSTLLWDLLQDQDNNKSKMEVKSKIALFKIEELVKGNLWCQNQEKIRHWDKNPMEVAAMAEATARVFDLQMVKEVEALKGQPQAYWGIVLWETSLEVLVPILKNSIRTFRWTNHNNNNSRL